MSEAYRTDTGSKKEGLATFLFIVCVFGIGFMWINFNSKVEKQSEVITAIADKIIKDERQLKRLK